MFSNRILYKFLNQGECFVAIKIVYIGQTVRVVDSWLRIRVSSFFFFSLFLQIFCKFETTVKCYLAPPKKVFKCCLCNFNNWIMPQE